MTKDLRFPASTRQVSRYLGVPSWRVNYACSSAQLDPEPEVWSGRRIWTAECVLAVAEFLGLLTDDRRQEINAAAAEARR